MFTRVQFLELNFEEKMKVMELKAKFHKKLSKAMADMERIPKNGFNNHHNYAYARESDVKDKIRPILKENGLSFTSDLIEHTEAQNGKWVQVDVKMLFTVVDTDTGYFEEFTQDGRAMDNGDKGIYKAYSNTIKYALMNYFLIPTGDDVEKDSPENEKPQYNPAAQNKTRQGAATGRDQSQPQQPNNQNQTPPTTGKPAWKQIMDMEDELVEVAGATKKEVRDKLSDKFGKIGKYKELPEQQATIILDQLQKWIDQYKYPQA